MPAVANDPVLPALRSDLRLLPGRVSEDGSPTWLIYDPLRHAYFSLRRTAFRLLEHWQAGLSLSHYLGLLAQRDISVSQEEASAFLNFLRNNNLLVADDKQAIDALRQQHQRRQQHWLRWLIQHYLFIRIPLVRPDRFLERALPSVRWLGGLAATRTLLVLGVLGIILAGRQWDSFAHTFEAFLDWQGALLFACTLVFTKSAHELGHAFVAKQHGCRVPTMGLAFLVMLPVLYTDTTDVWRLTERRHRLAVALAGIRTEISLALLATLLWVFLPEGVWRTATFFVASTAWISSLLINLSPFMRFDGYYALADWWGIDNLQPRAFAMARWALREHLFGFGEPAPEPLPERQLRLMVIYAWATWLYRLILFIGIALLVYHFFFKALGVLLFAVEIAWFILLPVRREMAQWWQRRRAMRLNTRTLQTLMLLAALLVLFLLPWRTTVSVPAVAHAIEHQSLFAPEPAQVAHLLDEAVTAVDSGELILRLDAPDIRHELEAVRSEIALLELKLDRRVGSALERDRSAIVVQQLAEKKAEELGLERRLRQLDIEAPFAGRLYRDQWPTAGQWVSSSDRLATIVGPGGTVVTAFVDESDLQRLQEGAGGRFLANSGDVPPIDVEIVSIDAVASDELPFVELHSDLGGPVASRKDPETDVYRTERAHYRMQLRPLEPLEGFVSHRQLGVVAIEGEAMSLGKKVWRRVAAVVIRESGF
jgi:putative peptide zinc metalloprotease protein